MNYCDAANQSHSSSSCFLSFFPSQSPHDLLECDLLLPDPRRKVYAVEQGQSKQSEDHKHFPVGPRWKRLHGTGQGVKRKIRTCAHLQCKSQVKEDKRKIWKCVFVNCNRQSGRGRKKEKNQKDENACVHARDYRHSGLQRKWSERVCPCTSL